MTDLQTIEVMKDQARDKLLFMSKLLSTYEKFQKAQVKEHEGFHQTKLINIKSKTDLKAFLESKNENWGYWSKPIIPPNFEHYSHSKEIIDNKNERLFKSNIIKCNRFFTFNQNF